MSIERCIQENFDRIAFAGLFLFSTACGSASQDSKDWDEETPNGPCVRGANLGMIQVEGQTGVGYDVDGDGRADEIDLNGDGISDGEDIDNDGVILLWQDFRGGGAVLSAHADKMLPASDPDDLRALDPRVNLLNSWAFGARE